MAPCYAAFCPPFRYLYFLHVFFLINNKMSRFMKEMGACAKNELKG